MGPDDAPALFQLYLENQAFLQPWEPTFGPDFFRLENFRRRLTADSQAARDDQTYHYGIFLTHSQILIGRVRLTNLVRGVFESANVGYMLDEAYNGRGYTTLAVRLMLQFAFEELGLHRVAAATLVHNQASIRVLEKAGFRREGLARRYLKIDGHWQDHLLWAITAEEF